MLSEEEKQRLLDIAKKVSEMEAIVVKEMQDPRKIFIGEGIPSWLTYMSSENLVKHSKRLTCWTIVIAFATITLILSTIAQIIMLSSL